MKTVDIESRTASNSYQLADESAEISQRSSRIVRASQDSSRTTEKAVNAEMQMVYCYAGAFLLFSLIPLLTLFALLFFWPEALLFVEPHQT